MPLTKQQFQDGCSYLTQIGTLAPFSPSGSLFIDANNQVVIDESDNNADVTPSEATLTQALADLAAQQNIESTLNTARQGLLDKAAIAKQFAPSIRAVLNEVWTQSEDSTQQPTRFETLATLMESQPNAFKNHFKNDLLQEVGIDFDALGVNLAARLLAATAAQRRQYCLYARLWIQGLAFLLIINKVV